MTDPAAADARRTRNSIMVYILLTAALSSIFYVQMIHRSKAGQGLGLLILGLMWCPGVSGLLTRLAFQGNLRGHPFTGGSQFSSSRPFFKRSIRMRITAPVVLALVARTLFAAGQQTQPAAQSPFQFQEVMVPVRDGVHLQTVILTPANISKALPILFRRTPYGVPEKAPEQISPSLKELMQDGYILVIQNLRGRFKSEGYFKLSSEVDLSDPKATNETTDAYDSIDWLVKNVPNNNGKVGMYGVSYDGLTAALTLLHPNPR